MKFSCCGLLYDTNDPETFWCIERYKMLNPSIEKIGGKKVEREIVYALFCKKNGCLKLEIHRYSKQNNKLNLVEKRFLQGKNAKSFFDRTRKTRIRLPQMEPKQEIKIGKNIPWVYGKTVDSTTQVTRYIDESGNRLLFKNNKLEPETHKSQVKILH